jgi:iron only hydrogenase large subunit-like protein
MGAYKDIYSVLLKAAAESKTQSEIEEEYSGLYDPYQISCLLNPKEHAPVWHFGNCNCGAETPGCVTACIFKAITKDDTGRIIIDKELCCGCSACIETCESGKLVSSRDILPVLFAIKHSEVPVYAMIAPAFVGQFDRRITPGKLRGALKNIGFAGMLEVALFADILTLKEALEFDRSIQNEQDFLLTSCCCPVWIAMIRRIYSQYITHVPGSVSPMVACGRTIKRIKPVAKTVFIGPCIAKKAEAREKDIADAVDYVLTFEEIHDIFEAFDIDLPGIDDDARDHSSMTGRIYARQPAEVSLAVQRTVSKLNPGRRIKNQSDAGKRRIGLQKTDGIIKGGKNRV